MSQLIMSKNYVAFFIFLFLMSCGDNDGTDKITRGHRDATKIQCSDASNKSACTQEVKANFISDGNEYADAKTEFIRSIEKKLIIDKKVLLIQKKLIRLAQLIQFVQSRYFLN